MLVASQAQANEVTRLARGFGRGFRGDEPYNAKDLLVELVLSRWFRGVSTFDNHPVRAVALSDVGAKRILTPEELDRKTTALSGFGWGRPQGGDGSPLRWNWTNLTNPENGYRLLYGGIDSDGVTDRARDVTSVMAGVAQSHAVSASCPIVMKELYLLRDEERRLFQGIDEWTSPISEFSGTFEVEADASYGKETLAVRGVLQQGGSVVTVGFLNDHYDEASGDRNLRVDRLDVRDSEGRAVIRRELEELDHSSDCNGPDGDHFALRCSGSVDVPVDIPSTGNYEIQVVVWADQAGDELARLAVSVQSDTERSAGSRAIKGKLVELLWKLHGVESVEGSPKVRGAYDLFVDVWSRRRASEHGHFDNSSEGIECDWPSDQYYLDGIFEDAFVYREDWGDEWGARHDWDWERINAHFETIDWSDPYGVARTWVVVLAYLMMDYRYLYL